MSKLNQRKILKTQKNHTLKIFLMRWRQFSIKLASKYLPIPMQLHYFCSTLEFDTFICTGDIVCEWECWQFLRPKGGPDSSDATHNNCESTLHTGQRSCLGSICSSFSDYFFWGYVVIWIFLYNLLIKRLKINCMSLTIESVRLEKVYVFLNLTILSTPFFIFFVLPSETD